MEEYTHLLDYIKDQDKTFGQRPFCEADSMVLSQLVYLRLERIVGKISVLSIAMPIASLAISERVSLMLNGVNDGERLRDLVNLLAASKRFGRMKVNYAQSRFSENNENQFAAASFFLDDGTVFVAFRGTDNTITGWRENFNMAYKPFVPAQKDSVEYLERVAVLTHQPIRVGGHSKGGNLAVYASVNCRKRVQERLLDIYCLDGPGFRRSIYEDAEYMRVKEKIHRIMPTGSLVGTLLIQSQDYSVVQSDGTGFAQHSLYNWRLNGAELIYAEKLSDDAVRFDRMLDDWIGRLSNEQLEGTVNTVFDIIGEINAHSFDEVVKYLESGELTAIKAYRMIEPEKRAQAAFVIISLIRAYIYSRRLPDNNE